MAPKKPKPSVKKKLTIGQINNVNISALNNTLSRVVAKLSKETTYKQVATRYISNIVSLQKVFFAPLLSLEVTAVDPATYNADINGFILTNPLPVGFVAYKIHFQLTNLDSAPMTGSFKGFVSSHGLTPDSTSLGQITVQPGQVFSSFMWCYAIDPGSYALQLNFIQVDPFQKAISSNQSHTSFQVVPVYDTTATCEYPFLIGDPQQISPMLSNALGIIPDYDSNGDLIGVHALDRENVFRQIKMSNSASYSARSPNQTELNQGWVGGYSITLVSSLLYSETIPNKSGPPTINNFSLSQTNNIDVLLGSSSDSFQAFMRGGSLIIQGFGDTTQPPKNNQLQRATMNLQFVMNLDQTQPDLPITVSLNGNLTPVGAAQKIFQPGNWFYGGPNTPGSYSGPDVSMPTNFPNEINRINYFNPFNQQLPLYASNGPLPQPANRTVSQNAQNSITALLWFGVAVACASPFKFTSPVALGLSLAACGVSLYGAVAIPAEISKVNHFRLSPPAGHAAPSGTGPGSGSGGSGGGGSSNPGGWVPGGNFDASCFTSFTCPPGWECVNGQCVPSSSGSDGTDF